jgi:NAD(P)-dependent dehydrogenase (short-subunit alcohol dehydrogenase family)
MHNDEMAGNVAIVTGASSGIGRATAVTFARAGAAVVGVARSKGALEELVDEIEAEGGTATAVAADLTDPEAIEKVVAETVEAYGRIDVLVNAAGVIDNGSIEDTSLADWDQMFAINLRAPFYLMQQAMPHLVESGGNVVNVSSVTGPRAFPGILAYCASKAGLDQLTHAAALEMAPKGVRINAVNPGVVETNLHKAGGMDKERYAEFLEHSKTTHPLGRVGQPGEVAELIYFLASPRAGWITGVTYLIDGGRGQTCAR